jgi:AhpD family alkylhydroperoxidase
VVEPLRIFAHHPKVMVGYAALELASERSRRVSARLKHLAELRAAMVCGCEWCLDFGSSISAEAGVGEEELRELPTYQRSPRFTELEKLVLDYATGMSRSPVDVPDVLFDRLRDQLDEAQLVEVTNIIALENYRARFNWALGIEDRGFSEGAFCRATGGATGGRRLRLRPWLADHRDDGRLEIAPKPTRNGGPHSEIAVRRPVRKVEHGEERPVQGCAGRPSIESPSQAYDGALDRSVRLFKLTGKLIARRPDQVLAPE